MKVAAARDFTPASRTLPWTFAVLVLSQFVRRDGTLERMALPLQRR